MAARKRHIAKLVFGGDIADERKTRKGRRKSIDWENIENDKEKYSAYLCSREWAVLREKVRERAGNKCERCKVLPMDACHHLTYERKYDERLEDLQAICTPCHEFTHGKSEADPQALRGWLSYISECKECGKRPVGGEWWFSEDALVGELDPIERAVKYLFNKYNEYDNMRLYLTTIGIIEDGEGDEEFSNYSEAAEELDLALLNTGMFLWLQHGSPSPWPPENVEICRKWLGLPRPKDLPIRKSAVQEGASI